MRFLPSFMASVGRRAATAASLPSIGSPVFGVDASISAKVFSDTAGTVQAVNVGAVARVNDAFGIDTARCQQGVAGQRPILVTGVQNGRAGLRFSGADQWLPIVGPTNPGTLFQGRDFTFLIVYRRPSVTGRCILFAAGSSTGGEGGAWADTITLNAREQGVLVLDRPSGTQYASATLASGTFPAGQLVKCVGRASQSAGMELTAKGALGLFSQTGAMPSTADVWTWDGAALASGMGAQDDPVMPREPANADIFEFRFWAARASDTQRDVLITYADAKWGS